MSFTTTRHFGAAAFFLLIVNLINVVAAQQQTEVSVSAYAPKRAQCPRKQNTITRRADGLSDAEDAFISDRKEKASEALLKWLNSIDKSLQVDKAPTIALTTSGGGYRSMLLGGGVVKAFDTREADGPLAGLYQALTYHGGLSGGSWLLSSITGNSFDTVSSISKSYWEPALEANVLYPTHQPPPAQVAAIEADLAAKQAAGFPPTTPEVWGRYLAYQLLGGPDGGVSKTMSGIASDPVFQRHDVPFPIITALGVQNINGSVCDAADNATTYEFTPFDFGSWDTGVAAFAQMKYLGTTISSDGTTGQCVTGFDNLGFILGASSSKFNEACGETLISVIGDGLKPLVEKIHPLGRRDIFNPVPNPFEFAPQSSHIDVAVTAGRDHDNAQGNDGDRYGDRDGDDDNDGEDDEDSDDDVDDDDDDDDGGNDNDDDDDDDDDGDGDDNDDDDDHEARRSWRGRHHRQPYGRRHRKPYGRHHRRPHWRPYRKPHGRPYGRPHGRPFRKPHGRPSSQPWKRPGGQKSSRDDEKPTPNANLPFAPLVHGQKELYLVDGGAALQNNPIWPFLQPARNIDVLIVNDNSADTDDNWPNGTEIERTYKRSIEAGLTRMPAVPTPEIFISKNLNKNATFFGCDQTDKITVVYLPNYGWNGYQSNKASAQFDYERNETQSMITAGGQIALQGGDPEWPLCLGCALTMKASRQKPQNCQRCFDKYCYKG